MSQTAEQSADSAARPRAHDRRTWLLWGLFFFLVVYPLSTGPVFRLVVAGYLPKQTVEIYEPLKPVTKAAFAKAFFEWYLFEVWKLERYR